MNRQRAAEVVAISATVLALSGLALSLWVLSAGPAVTMTTMARLTPGMSEGQVKSVLGPPTADLSASPPPGVSPPPSGGRLLEYAGDRATARIEFDASGRLLRCYPVVRKVTALERLRGRLNWW